jgi:hypothetical protein
MSLGSRECEGGREAGKCVCCKERRERAAEWGEIERERERARQRYPAKVSVDGLARTTLIP